VVKIARLAAAIAAASALGATALSAGAAAPKPTRDVSRNWAGYAVTGRSFTKVTATWTQPSVTCGPGDRGARFSVWVGLGGYVGGAQGLEQTGVSSDCNSISNRPEFYAWYEVTPAPGIRVRHVRVRAGDTITATVEVGASGTTVDFRLQNRTRRWSFRKRLPVDGPNLSSAEWIAEAPAGCTPVRCGSQRLANFGSLRVRKIATVAGGHEGRILDPGWQAIAIRQAPSSHHAYVTGSTAGAAPRALAADGAAFTLVWQPNAVSEQPGREQPSTKPVDPLIAGPRQRLDNS
jgi:hypothetical protein